jgi:hypothetical protein
MYRMFSRLRGGRSEEYEKHRSATYELPQFHCRCSLLRLEETSSRNTIASKVLCGAVGGVPQTRDGALANESYACIVIEATRRARGTNCPNKFNIESRFCTMNFK